MSIIANDLFEYLEDSTLFSQSDDKADRTKVSIINRALQFCFANTQLKHIEEYGRINTVAPIQNDGGVNATSGSVNLTFTSEIFTAGDSALSGQYISIDSDERLYLITEVPSTSGLTLHADYPYLGSGSSSGTFTVHYPVAQLPSGVETIDNPKNEFYLDSIPYISPQEWLNYARNISLTLSEPQYFTLMNNQVTNKFSLFFWPAPVSNKSVDFRYWRYPARINSSTDVVDWPEEDLWVLQAVMDMFAVQYVNFGEDTGAQLQWYNTKRKEARAALTTIVGKNFRRKDLGHVGMPSTSQDVLSRDLRRYPNNL